MKLYERNGKVVEAEHFVVFYEDDSDSMIVHHLVGYENMPSMDNVFYNRQELVDDPDFGIGKKALSLKVMIVDKETANKILEGYLDEH